MAFCTNLQLLEPENDAIVASGGSNDQSIDESGKVALSIGQTLVSVAFSTTKISNDYQFEVYIENLVDADPAAIRWIPVTKLTTGFTLELDGSPESVNYKLYWRVLARSGQSTGNSGSSSSTSTGESGSTTLILGGSTQTITFTTAKTDATYGFSELRVENTTDGAGQQVEWIQVTGKTTTGFTIAISPPPDTSNYKLIWETK